MMDVDYGFTRKLAGVSFTKARERITVALKNEGFGILTEIDVKATMKAKLDEEFRNYVILGACNPPIAHRALSVDPGIGLLLPCNVVVRQLDGASVKVAFMDPAAVLSMVDQPGVTELAGEVRRRLERVRDALGGQYGSC